MGKFNLTWRRSCPNNEQFGLLTLFSDKRQQKTPGSRHRPESVFTSGLCSLFDYWMIEWRVMICEKNTERPWIRSDVRRYNLHHYDVLCPFKEHYGANGRITHHNSEESRMVTGTKKACIKYTASGECKSPFSSANKHSRTPFYSQQSRHLHIRRRGLRQGIRRAWAGRRTAGSIFRQLRHHVYAAGHDFL